jgi:hypothetical protein
MFSKLLLLFGICSVSTSALAQTTYHCNGNHKQSGTTWYHANGNHLKLSTTLYHSNGNHLLLGTSMYHPNGNHLKLGTTYYHSNGNHLILGTSVYHANGNHLKLGTTCYYENGNSMGSCPNRYTLTAKDSANNSMISIEIDLVKNTLISYEVQVTGNGFVEAYEVNDEGEILNLVSTCSNSSDGAVDSRAVENVRSLFNQTNNATKAEIKSHICD